MGLDRRCRVSRVRSRTPATRLTLALLLSIGIGATGAGQSTRRDEPTLPDTPYEYADAHLTLPAHFTADGPDGIAATDNTPDDNPTTADGATLGRALFYDTRLSADDTVSCASCQRQRHGFSDPRRFSVWFDRRSTRRHAMSLTNARYYARGRFFWDERAETLEAQVLAPIQDPIEMGLPLEALEEKLRAAPYYPPLFERAYGTRAITADRIARALAQFVRALVSSRSPYDEARAAGPLGSPPFAARLTETERRGHRLFVAVPGAGVRATGCGRCHVTGAQTSLSPRNIGLDRRLAVTGGPVRPVRLNLTDTEIDALVAFLHTLTDEAFLTDPKFADPFALADSNR